MRMIFEFSDSASGILKSSSMRPDRDMKISL